MKAFNVICATLLLVISSTGFSDPKPGTREILLDNAAVQVVRLTYPPGTESGMHSHEFPNRAIYFVKGGRLELVPADGQAQVLMVTDGDAVYLPAVTHNVKNTGDNEIVIIETEIK